MTSYWKMFIESNALTREEISIPDSASLAGFGGQFEILSEEHARDEDEGAYPGIIVSKDGFHAVGGCLTGTGDQYFINEKDGEGGPLYRIYHDSVRDEDYDKKEAIAVVLKDYREILKYKDA